MTDNVTFHEEGTEIVEIPGKEVKIGDYYLAWKHKDNGHWCGTELDGVVLDFEAGMFLTEGNCEGKPRRFSMSSEYIYRIKRKISGVKAVPFSPGLLKSAENKMQALDDPNGAYSKLTAIERLNWSIALREKRKEAEEKERNRVLVDLEFDQWE